MKQATNGNTIKNKILFISMPADGHFNPLTGLAKHLQSIGYDVRWYTQDYYKEKLAKLGIHHYPYVHAPQLNQKNFESFFKDRVNHKSQVAKLKFDLEHCFINPVTEIILDVKAIQQEFLFDLVIADIMTFCIPLIKKEFGVPVIAGGIVPLMETSTDLPPGGLGLTPSDTWAGRLKQSALRFMTDKVLFKKPNKLFKDMLASYGVPDPGGNVFDMLYRSADVVLQSGTPAFEYQRSDMGCNIVFAGSLLPYAKSTDTEWYDERVKQYKKVVVVTQGTVEKDVAKIIVPTLEAFKNDKDTLIVCTTGGSQTAELKKRYAQKNIIIEDFIPFGCIMPFAHAYVTNGGYGGVMLGIKNKLPLVVAGVHEGKNEICARIGFFKYGINLKTETPLPAQLYAAVNEVISNPVYKTNVKRLAYEFSRYQPNELCEKYVDALLKPAGTSVKMVASKPVEI